MRRKHCCAPPQHTWDCGPEEQGDVHSPALPQASKAAKRLWSGSLSSYSTLRHVQCSQPWLFVEGLRKWHLRLSSRSLSSYSTLQHV